MRRMLRLCSQNPENKQSAIASLMMHAGLVIAFTYAWWVLDDLVVDVVTWEVLSSPRSKNGGWIRFIPPTIIIVTLILPMLVRRKANAGMADSSDSSGEQLGTCLFGWFGFASVLYCAVTWNIYRVDPSTGMAALPSFAAMALFIVAIAFAADWVLRDLYLMPSGQFVNAMCFFVLLLLIATSTTWQVQTQYQLWQHLSLGYTDIGAYTRKLESCLAGSGLVDAFADTSMGAHFSPLFYVLAPVYAIFHHPVFLMIVSPLALNLPALIFFAAARAISGSAAIGLLIGIAWLALPSVSQLPIAGTFGFQTIYLATPFISLAICAYLLKRPYLSHSAWAMAFLCEETVCGVALGWGIYLWFIQKQRKTGMLYITASLGYLLLTNYVIIPNFLSGGSSERVGLFGTLNLNMIAYRLSRERTAYLILTLLVPLIVGLWRAPRKIIAALPVLLAVALLQNHDYLSIKYWHHTTAQPILFAAAMCGVIAVTNPARQDKTEPETKHGTYWSSTARNTDIRCGPAFALVVGVILAHHLAGLSPLTHAGQRSSIALADHRLNAVSFVKSNFSPYKTTIGASDRLAAHFWDYRGLSTLARVAGGKPPIWPDVMVIDPQDQWDPVIQIGGLDSLLSQARAADFVLIHRQGEVMVLLRSNFKSNDS